MTHCNEQKNNIKQIVNQLNKLYEDKCKDLELKLQSILERERDIY